MIILPAMRDAQAASWHGLMDVYEHLSTGWTLIGGQMVHLHCAERGSFPPRPTDDIDAVIDVRAEPLMLNRFTDTLTNIGFAPDRISADGLQHRWRRDKAQLDVLLPDGIGDVPLPGPASLAAPRCRHPAAPRHYTAANPSRSPSKVAPGPFSAQPLSVHSSRRLQRTPAPATQLANATAMTSPLSLASSPPPTSGRKRSARRTDDDFPT